MSKLSGLLLALVVLGGLAPSARAEEYETVVLDRNIGASTPYRFHARVLGTPAGSRPGGRGYVRIELVNPTDKARSVRIRLAPMGDSLGGEFTVYQALRVEAGQRTSLDMPLCNTPWGTGVHFIVEGQEMPEVVRITSTYRSGRRSLPALLVGLRDDGGWPAYIDGTASGRGGSFRGGSAVYLREPHELPGSWTLLSGFDLVVVRGTAEGLTPERQEVLLRYVAGGGNLVVTEMRDQVGTPFAELEQSARREAAEDTVSGFHGLGKWLLVDDAADSSTPAVRTWLEHSEHGRGSILDRGEETRGGGAPEAFWLPLEIPGLGEVPVRAFFFMILLFVIVVGPVSYLYFRRRRRLAMLLVTIPTAGFLCAGVVLAYGMFSEGFGIIGSIRSITVLDQRTQMASVVAGRTLYAGLQPGELTPDVDSVVATSRGGSGGQAPRMELGSGQRLDGAVLPSRTPTPLVTTHVGRSRERLRFRRRPDGDYDVLSAPGLVPLDEPGSVLFRAPDGSYFRSISTGRLARGSFPSGGVRSGIHDVAQALSDMQVGSGEVVDEGNPWDRRMRFRSRREMELLASRATPFRVWLDNHVRELPPGSYLARVRRAPVTESLGLDVEYRSEEHVVLGLLGPEDVTGE